jgi:phenylacetate-coenzyme A ligase PaaK-like adenylate-forming protein
MGRSDSIFRFPEKQVALTRFDDVMIQRVLQADAYQFAQVAPMQIEVRYVSGVDAAAAECQQVSDHLRHLLQVDVLITFSRVDGIPFNAGEKQQRIVREFDAFSS